MKPDKKVTEAQTFMLLDKHDVRDMQTAIEELACCECHGGAHCYSFPSRRFSALGKQTVFVVSAYPLSPKQIHAVKARFESQPIGW